MSGDPLGAAIGAAAILAAFCWAASLKTGNYSQVDRLWSIAPPLYVCWFAAWSGFADLRLDVKDGLFGKVSGGIAVVPGKPAGSAVLRRIKSSDPDERMPPLDSGKKITAAEMELIERIYRSPRLSRREVATSSRIGFSGLQSA